MSIAYKQKFCGEQDRRSCSTQFRALQAGIYLGVGDIWLASVKHGADLRIIINTDEPLKITSPTELFPPSSGSTVTPAMPKWFAYLCSGTHEGISNEEEMLYGHWGPAFAASLFEDPDEVVVRLQEPANMFPILHRFLRHLFCSAF